METQPSSPASTETTTLALALPEPKEVNHPHPIQWARAHARVLVVGALLIGAAAGINAGGQALYRNWQECTAHETTALETYQTSRGAMQEMIDAGNNVLSTYSDDDVADPATRSALKNAIYSANIRLHTDEAWTLGGTSVFDWASITARANHNERLAGYEDEASQAVSDAQNDVLLSTRVKAQSDLQAARDAAQKKLDAVGAQVSDTSTTQALKDQIAQADTQLAVAPEDAANRDDYRNLIQPLNDAVAKVDTSHSDWLAAQRRAAAYASQQAAQRAAARNGGTVRRGSNGTWYVSYTNFYGGDSANADGTLAEWRDGYYVAHNWSSNGKAIASRPQTVVVNGKTYAYKGEEVVSRGTTWNQVEGFVHNNNGIGFQTCVSGGYLVTHYEPVN